MIEQWARQQSKSTSKNADEVMAAYADSLPTDFKQRFPVLRDLYGKLSADLHSASGSPALFDGALPEIVRHFEARRLFELDGPP
jgi:hypothetical protein